MIAAARRSTEHPGVQHQIGIFPRGKEGKGKGKGVRTRQRAASTVILGGARKCIVASGQSQAS